MLFFKKAYLFFILVQLLLVPVHESWLSYSSFSLTSTRMERISGLKDIVSLCDLWKSG